MRAGDAQHGGNRSATELRNLAISPDVRSWVPRQPLSLIAYDEPLTRNPVTLLMHQRVNRLTLKMVRNLPREVCETRISQIAHSGGADRFATARFEQGEER